MKIRINDLSRWILFVVTRQREVAVINVRLLEWLCTIGSSNGIAIGENLTLGEAHREKGP